MQEMLVTQTSSFLKRIEKIKSDIPVVPRLWIFQGQLGARVSLKCALKISWAIKSTNVSAASSRDIQVRDPMKAAVVKYVIHCQSEYMQRAR